MKSASKVIKVPVYANLFSGRSQAVKVISKSPRCGLCGRKVGNYYQCEHCNERI